MVTAFFQIKNSKQFFQILLVGFLIIKKHRENNILLYSKLWNKIERLKDKANISAPEHSKFSIIHGENILSINHYLARRWRVQSTNHV